MRRLSVTLNDREEKLLASLAKRSKDLGISAYRWSAPPSTAEVVRWCICQAAEHHKASAERGGTKPRSRRGGTTTSSRKKGGRR